MTFFNTFFGVKRLYFDSIYSLTSILSQNRANLNCCFRFSVVAQKQMYLPKVGSWTKDYYVEYHHGQQAISSSVIWCVTTLQILREDQRLIIVWVISRSGPVFCLFAWSKLRLCSANHRPGYWSNLPCDWPNTAWAYSEQETENGPRLRCRLKIVCVWVCVLWRVVYVLFVCYAWKMNVKWWGILLISCYLKHHCRMLLMW